MEKIKIRGLARVGAWILGLWGGLVACKAVYDLFFGGEPEANLYAPQKWAFVTQEQWRRYAGFELVYGLSLLALAWYLIKLGRLLPVTISRAKRGPEFSLFD